MTIKLRSQSICMIGHMGMLKRVFTTAQGKEKIWRKKKSRELKPETDIGFDLWAANLSVEWSVVRQVNDDQCDQIMKYKVAQLSQHCPKSCQIIFSWKLHYFKQPKKLPEYLGYFCKQICWQEIQKIAQSGHTDDDPIFCFARKRSKSQERLKGWKFHSRHDQEYDNDEDKEGGRR